MLKEISLQSLAETKLKEMFQTALNEVSFSLSEHKDIPGARSISIDITFKQMNGYIDTELACTHKVPGRKVHAIAAMETTGCMKIDTLSGDARQPDLLEHAGANVTSIDDARKEKVAQ